MAVASDADEVAPPRTISTRRMTLAGLKKCRPRTVAGRRAAAAISSMFSVDVLVARRQSGFAIASSAPATCFFNARFSNTASMMRSASPNPS